MTDPTVVLRSAQSGPIVRGTPANVLAFDATGERVGGVPQGGGSSGVSPLAVSESGSTGDWFGNGSSPWIRQKDGGGDPLIECSFADWNPGDILQATWFGNFKPIVSPGPGSALFQIQVSLDGGGTWRNLAPAFASLQFGDAVAIPAIYSSTASGSVALPSAPLVRIAYQSGFILVDYGSLANGVTLRCERYEAGAYVPAGTLL